MSNMKMGKVRIISMPRAGLAPEVVPTMGVNFRLTGIDFNQAIENIGVLGDAITYEVASVIAKSLIQLMALAQPRVPYYAGGELGEESTGKLRESGRVMLVLSGAGSYSTIVGYGKIDGTVEANLSKLRPSSFKGSKCKAIGGNITYSRINDEGEDIALWAHESLLAYEERGSKAPAARTPGTGPKYLEIPWLENKDVIVANIQQSIKDLNTQGIGSKIMRWVKRTIIRKRRDKYGVDVVKLVLSQIGEQGYYGSGTMVERPLKGIAY